MDADHWAQQAAKRAVEKCVVEMGREPSGVEAAVMLLSMQIAVLTSDAVERGAFSSLSSFWEKVAGASMGAPRSVQ